MMRRALVAVVSGVLFGVGLSLSGMARPTKVLAFLDVFGAWDPSLLFVMLGAVSVHMVGVQLARRRTTTLTGEPLAWPTRTGVDRALVIGAAIFGVGWGLGGFCPGPAVVSASAGNTSAIVFAVAMVIGVIARSRILPLRKQG